MSNALFPTLPGLSWNVVRRPVFSTIVQRAASGRETRAALFSFPIWEWDLSYDLLRDDASQELRTLLGFFLQRQGAFDSFLFRDPTDNAVVDQSIGLGNGTRRNFQLVRALGGSVEPMFDIDGVPAVKAAGTPQVFGVQFSLGATGEIVFTTPPPAGAPLHATFSYLFRVRFRDDLADFNQFAFRLWELQSLSLVGVRP